MATDHFKDPEICCPHCGRAPAALSQRLLEELRCDFDETMVVGSGMRCLEYDLGFGGKGAHPRGAFDIETPDGRYAYWLVYHAMRRGWTGIGVRGTGPRDKRMIHLDRRAHVGAELTPWLWSY